MRHWASDKKTQTSFFSAINKYLSPTRFPHPASILKKDQKKKTKFSNSTLASSMESRALYTCYFFVFLLLHVIYPATSDILAELMD
jgi:hypothetical protein